ncbi:DUF4097 family beta strand repeat-containing protein [Echinicola jeungdonensis]|uniref:DUF4097 family beta strand repeat-containing protein n=1 Tax=Echinicola jeungdonensis TaxID=709343 RepID=A0ABV5J6Y3_9BACT|nr:DUF4097 family beta strand repeat-containing protein [Echinicola jeungdonensis]MDN3670779.1 DUF4097 family beta strand repeat-containing protein [Echinicola jeungdonensis]
MRHPKAMHNRCFSSLYWLLLIPLWSLINSCNNGPKHAITNIQKELDGISKVEINGGPLEVSYEGDANRSNFFLNAYFESANKEVPGIEYSIVDDLLIISFDISGNFPGWLSNNKGFISLAGPKNVKLVIKNGSGPVFVKNVDHKEIIINTGSGKMEVSNLSGNKIHLSAGSGKINGENVAADMEITVRSGHGKLENLKGSIKGEVSSGYLELNQVDGKVDGKVSSGKMKLQNVSSLGNLKVSSGSIQVENGGLGSSTFLECSSGSIHIQTDDDLSNFNFYLKASSGSVKVGNQKDGDKLEIDNGAPETVNGNVSSGSIRILN